MDLRRQILKRAAESNRRIAFHLPDEPSTVDALTRLDREGIVAPFWICDAAKRDTGVPPGVSFLDPGQDPLRSGLDAVRGGLVDGLVVSAVDASALWNLLPGSTPAFAFGLIDLDVPTAAGDAVLALADLAGNADPDPERLAAIARATATQYRLLCGKEPRVALLSFSTHGSANHAKVSRVQQALALARETEPTLAIDGELQGDAALAPAVGRSKAPGSAVAGRANVLICPDTASARIAAGLVARWGAVRVLGPFLGHLERPVNVVSPSGDAAGIVFMAAVTAVQAG